MSSSLTALRRRNHSSGRSKLSNTSSSRFNSLLLNSHTPHVRIQYCYLPLIVLWRWSTSGWELQFGITPNIRSLAQFNDKSLSDFKSTWDDSFEKHPTLLMQSSVPCQQDAVEESTCYSWYVQQNLTNWGNSGSCSFHVQGRIVCWSYNQFLTVSSSLWNRRMKNGKEKNSIPHLIFPFYLYFSLFWKKTSVYSLKGIHYSL